MKKLLISIFLVLLLISPKILSAQTQNPSNQEASSSDAIRDKVQQKIENAKNTPKAYIGTVTDKTQDSLQTKSIDGEIEFVYIDPENTDFVKIGKSTSAIKYSDLAIGDFVIAMGYLNNNQTQEVTLSERNDVLNAKRILVTDPLEKLNRINICGIITKIEKKTISIKQADQEEVEITFPKRWIGPEINELNINDKIYVSLIETDNSLEVRTIQVDNGTSPTP